MSQAASAGGTDERTVYVSNLHEKVTEELLRELFIQVGPVETVAIRGGGGGPNGSGNSNEPRFAFVTFADEDSVLFACEMLDQIELFRRNIRVRPRERTEQFKVYKQLGLEAKIQADYLGAAKGEQQRGQMPPPQMPAPSPVMNMLQLQQMMVTPPPPPFVPQNYQPYQQLSQRELQQNYQQQRNPHQHQNRNQQNRNQQGGNYNYQGNQQQQQGRGQQQSGGGGRNGERGGSGNHGRNHNHYNSNNRGGQRDSGGGGERNNNQRHGQQRRSR